MPHYGNYLWNNPCGKVFETEVTWKPASTSATNELVSGLSFNVPRRGLYRVFHTVDIISANSSAGAAATPVVTWTDDRASGASTNATYTAIGLDDTLSCVTNLTEIGNIGKDIIQCKDGSTITFGFTYSGAEANSGSVKVNFTIVAV